jgi:hypothetical protein
LIPYTASSYWALAGQRLPRLHERFMKDFQKLQRSSREAPEKLQRSSREARA